MRRYLGQLLEGGEALAALRRGVQLLQAAVDAQVRSKSLRKSSSVLEGEWFAVEM